MPNNLLDEEKKFIKHLGTFSIQGRKTSQETLIRNYISSMENGEHRSWTPGDVIILCEYAREQLR